MKRFLFLILLAILSALPFVGAQNCIEPTSELHLTKDTIFCDGHYKVSRIVADAENITLHCGGATLEGDLGSDGIIITKSNVKLKSCTLITYQKAVSMLNAPAPSFENVVLKNNVIGIYAVNTRFKPHGVLFEDNERNMVLEEKEAPTRTIENHVLPELLAALNISTANHAAAAKRVALEKTITVEEKENRTTITVSLTAKEDIPNLLVYEHIPKELAATADDVVFSYPDVQVVNPDPDFLIPIGRIKINTKVKIEYRLNKKVSAGDPMPSTVVAEGENENNEPPVEEPIDTTAPAEVTDLSPPSSVVWWTLLFLGLALVVTAAVYHIEKKGREQH
ncbi:MAG: hypothetical protein Q7R76_04795 [Candidatus Woesearchaeota archaeon]|nr:hypothetical protein [Candidatus Woesearchaeota archaeon]